MMLSTDANISKASAFPTGLLCWIPALYPPATLLYPDALMVLASGEP